MELCRLAYCVDMLKTLCGVAYKLGGIMQIYQCPNCGRTYNYGEFNSSNIILSCMNCRYPLKKKEDIKKIAHPELNTIFNNKHIIGTVNDPTKPSVECPYCHSTDTKKITNTSKAIHTAIFGIFSMSRNSKQFHCNNCGADF